MPHPVSFTRNYAKRNQIRAHDKKFNNNLNLRFFV